ncbi:hypothetical protein SESBI_08429 [Sesbania bispinosa]|nr:hypothetical protein SESBI_08429 [Sesbania bispinosa]
MASVEQKANKVATLVQEEITNKVASPVEEGDNNTMEEIGFKEKKPKNPTEKERPEPSAVQPPEPTMDMDLLNKIGNSLIVQMKVSKLM